VLVERHPSASRADPRAEHRAAEAHDEQPPHAKPAERPPPRPHPPAASYLDLGRRDFHQGTAGGRGISQIPPAKVKTP
jgi:hypothetical protein